MVKALFMVGVITVLGSCAAMQESMKKDVCREHRAYEVGYEDSKQNQRMSTGRMDICEENVKAQMYKSYKEGFMAGEEAKRPQTQISIVQPKSKGPSLSLPGGISIDTGN